MAKKPNLTTDQFFQDLLDLDTTSNTAKKHKLLPQGAGSVLKTSKKFNIKNIQDYSKAINNFPMASSLKPGFFYSFTYGFKKNYKWDKLRFFDYQPLSFIWWTGKNKAGYPIALGLNFHRLPILVRQKTINFIIKYEGINTNKVTRRRKLNVDYQFLRGITKKIPFAVRMYRIDRMYRVKLVPLRYIRQILTFYPETLYSAKMSAIFAEYRKYKPKPRKP